MKWRYVDSPGFSYLFFGEPQNVGIVVARIEKVYCPERKDIHQLKVLRIIEVVPFDARVWNGRQLDDMVGLIMGVLSWAKEQGCCAADFQCSTRRLDELFYLKLDLNCTALIIYLVFAVWLDFFSLSN